MRRRAPVAASAPRTGAWRDRLKARLTSYGAVLFQHPEIARMALSVPDRDCRGAQLTEVGRAASRRVLRPGRKIATADPARFPKVAQLGDELLSGDGEARFDWALDVLIDGILAAGSRRIRPGT